MTRTTRRRPPSPFCVASLECRVRAMCSCGVRGRRRRATLRAADHALPKEKPQSAILYCTSQHRADGARSRYRPPHRPRCRPACQSPPATSAIRRGTTSRPVDRACETDTGQHACCRSATQDANGGRGGQRLSRRSWETAPLVLHVARSAHTGNGITLLVGIGFNEPRNRASAANRGNARRNVRCLHDTSHDRRRWQRLGRRPSWQQQTCCDYCSYSQDGAEKNDALHF